MSRFVHCTVAAVSITLTLLGCQDAAAPLSTVKPVSVAFVTVEPPTASVLAGQYARGRWLHCYECDRHGFDRAQWSGGILAAEQREGDGDSSYGTVYEA